jgi:NADH-quinone oxidoreductase subunit N
LFVLFFWRSTSRGEAPELVGSLLLIVAGLMVVVLASDLVLLFVGLELVSIPTYVVLYLGRPTHDAASQEATAKYFFLSVLSSALLLYGFSFLYGVAGSTSLFEIYASLSKAAPDARGPAAIAGLALILILAGLGFRITAVPFHFYAPDVYQGTSHGNAALLAVAPKIAGFTALVRVVAVAMPLGAIGWQLALGLSVLTMTVGNLLALWQNNIRRMLAYSSIAHAGYMLIGFSVGLAATSVDARFLGNLDGLGSLFFYLVVYALATIGAFAVLAYLSGDERQIDGVDELAGLGGTHPWIAAVMAIFMFSLTGLPPLAGFWGKFTLFLGALGVDSAASEPAHHQWKWFVGLAVAGSINAAIAAAYYLRVVGVMYFRSSLTVPAARRGLGAGLVGAICAAGVLAASVDPDPLIDQANRASQAARATFAGPAAPADSAAAVTTSAGPQPAPQGTRPRPRSTAALVDHQR